MGSSLRFISVRIAVALSLVSIAIAEPYGGPFQVNRLTHTSGNVMWSDAATGANGDTVIMWLGGTGGNGIYIQRYDAAGRALQSQEGLIGAGTSNVVQRVTVAGNGNFAIASHSNDGSGLGVFVTIYDRAGNVIVPQFRVNDSIDGDQTVTSMAMNANGQFVVTFTSATAPPTGLQAIYIKRFQANGAAFTSEILVHSNGASGDLIMGVDSGIDSAGNFVIAWSYSGIFSTQSSDVYARRYSSNGAALGATFLVNTYTDGGQDFNHIAVSATGSFVIAWTSAQPGGNIVAGRRYDAAGNPLGDEFQISSPITSVIAGLDVRSTPVGGFVVTWGASQIMARSYGANGAALEPELQVSQAIGGFPIQPYVGVDRDGNSFVSWMEQNFSATTPIRMWARRYAPSGIVIEPLTNGQVVSPLAGATNSWRYFKLSVQAGQTILDAAIFGGAGDADMYIRYGALPTLSTWDVRPFLTGNNESVRITNIPPGDWYIGIQGFNAYSGLSLQATAF